MPKSRKKEEGNRFWEKKRGWVDNAQEHYGKEGDEGETEKVVKERAYRRWVTKNSVNERGGGKENIKGKEGGKGV